MAQRPEPLQALLAEADLVIVAEVIEVLSTGQEPPAPESAHLDCPHASGVGYQEAKQRVRLRVANCLRGEAAVELEVVKPVAPYLLAVGDSGAFFIAAGEILGRYGPDSYREELVVAALE